MDLDYHFVTTKYVALYDFLTIFNYNYFVELFVTIFLYNFHVNFIFYKFLYKSYDFLRWTGKKILRNYKK